MKKAFALALIFILMLTFGSCSDGTAILTDAETAETTTVAPVEIPTESVTENTTEDNEEVILSGDIVFDKNNKATVKFIGNNETETIRAFVTCSFDGANRELEWLRMLTLGIFLKDTVNVSVSNLDLDAITMVMWIDGELKILGEAAVADVYKPYIEEGFTFDEEILDLEYAFVKEQFSVLLGVSEDANTSTQSELASPTIENTANAYSRTNPAAIGITQNINVDTTLLKYDADITIQEVIRNEDAYKKIKDANMFNEDPQDGNEFVLFRVAITINSVEDDKAVSLSRSMFKFFSSSNAEYSMSSVVAPDPKFTGQLYAGASSEGWLVIEVSKNDTSPKCVFQAKYDGTGGIWFSLSE